MFKDIKKRTLIVGILIAVIGITVVYLNRSYAHIYDGISEADLRSPDQQRVYQFGADANDSLVYVAIGDSLTSGVGVDSYEQSYPYRLGQMLAEGKTNVTLHTFAVPGARTVNALGAALDAAIQIRPDIVTVLLGTNDVHGNIPKKTFEANYDAMLARLTTETDATVYVVAIPYIGAPDLIAQPYRLYFDVRTRAFNDVLKQLAATYGATYVHLYRETTRAERGTADYYAADLFHPSNVGYALWADILYESINQ